MPKTHIRLINFRSCFPPRDRVATNVARLCILREDLMLELMGMQAAALDKLDENSVACRRVYFWRNTFRTMVEIRETLNTLNALSAFRDWLALEEKEVRERYEAIKKEVNRACEDFLYGLRCEVGGHLDETAMQETLDGMEFDRGGFIEIGDKIGSLHYKFTGELLLCVLLRTAPKEGMEAELESTLKRMASLIPVINSIADIIALYMRRTLPE